MVIISAKERYPMLPDMSSSTNSVTVKGRINYVEDDPNKWKFSKVSTCEIVNVAHNGVFRVFIICTSKDKLDFMLPSIPKDKIMKLGYVGNDTWQLTTYTMLDILHLNYIDSEFESQFGVV